MPSKLRPNNVHRAVALEGLLSEIEQQQGKNLVFRTDSAFPKPEMYEALEGRDVKYTIRLPPSDNLARDMRELLMQPVER